MFCLKLEALGFLALAMPDWVLAVPD